MLCTWQKALRTARRHSSTIARNIKQPKYYAVGEASKLASVWEIDHVGSEEERSFLSVFHKQPLVEQSDRAFLERLAVLMLRSETLDAFMAKRFGQVKRYGLEGGEGMMVAMGELLRGSEAVIAMPHRGRLNLMTGLLEYPLEALFARLKGKRELPEGIPGSGDVLSHLWLDNVNSQTGHRHCLLPNPSHLEAVNPVHMGVARSLPAAVPIQIHGDAAFSGQGVVQETLQLSQLPGFTVNGTVHLIVNNQIGFTTPSHMGRSTDWSSDPVKMISAPVFHVTGDNPMEIVKASRAAAEYRRRFQRDALVDIVCYRRWGHNELDEPSFTQPLMYKEIRDRPLPGTLFAQQINLTAAKDICDEYYGKLDAALAKAPEYRFTGIGLQPNNAYTDRRDHPTAAIKQSVNLPDGFQVHPRLAKMHIESRLKATDGKKVDWATAEAAAFYSLLKEGKRVRLVGQDVGRGTFSHRHAIFYDQATNSPHTPLASAGTRDKSLEIVDSPLCELSVLGFEYGQSVMDDDKLCLWEAQFGDFFNPAQVIIDTFVSSGEQKWGLQSGLVLLLPHGYNGAGPEHSSCRIERFLQASDEPVDVKVPRPLMGVNWQVAQPTTPANYFHLLRRQLARNYRKPLVIANAKQLLRLAQAVSTENDFTTGTSFQPILFDPQQLSSPSCIFTSGEMAYDLEKELPNTLIVRLEELCPFPTEKITELLNKCKAARFAYCQPEPENMGAWKYVKERLEQLVHEKLTFIGRPASAAPATGYAKQHLEEHQELLIKAKHFANK